MSDRHSFLSDNFYIGSDSVQCPTIIWSTEYFTWRISFRKMFFRKFQNCFSYISLYIHWVKQNKPNNFLFTSFPLKQVAVFSIFICNVGKSFWLTTFFESFLIYRTNSVKIFSLNDIYDIHVTIDFSNHVKTCWVVPITVYAEWIIIWFSIWLVSFCVRQGNSLFIYWFKLLCQDCSPWIILS